MSSREQLDLYLEQARRRLQAILWSRSAAGLCLLLLIVTLVASVLLGRTGFSSNVVLVARLLLLAVAVASGVYLWRAWRGLAGEAGGAALERALPVQSGRVLTYIQERRKAEQGVAPVLLDLLAEDANRIADQTPLREAIPPRHVLVPGALAAVALAALIGLLFFAGTMGSGARRLWLGSLPPAAQLAAAAGGIAVKPGDVAVRRNQDLPIEAVVAGTGGEVKVHVQFAGTDAWEAAPMETDGKGGHAFTLFAVREAARYYVTAGRLRSAEYDIRVVDLPQIESLRLTYNYPAWTGLPKRTEEGGDIRAVAGTRVELEVVTNSPMEGPLLVVNDTQSDLEQGGAGVKGTATGSLVVKEPGHYRIATRFGNEIVPLSQDLAIDVVPDEKPTVQILRPGRDYQATNIEEVPVSVKAQDDFRLESLTLRYSVNGGDWRDEKLNAGATDIQSAALLRLEEMQQLRSGGAAPLLQPGDLVSYFAVARDHGSSTQTDLFLIQVQPFDRRYTQSQANGGGGGGAGEEEDQSAISQRQREILLATWNLQRTDRVEGREAERKADSARMLSEVQKTLAEQANTLVERARARLLTGTDENVKKFVESLEEATKAMRPAVEQLAKQDLQGAVKNEQQALQHLLRAESTFREIQVAMQSSGGGGGGAQAGRDVSEMTELELDLEKNQYETEPQMTAEQRSDAEDELTRRLKELARRQEQLAREAARQAKTPEAQRWQQEQLRREAEQLRRELEQLAQQRNGQSGSQSGSQSQQSQGSSSSAAAEAAEQVAQAMRDMQQQDSVGAADRASQQLNRAREQLERGRREAEGQRFEDLARNARELGERQRSSEEELRAALGSRPPPSIANPRAPQGSGMGFEQTERLANTKREIQSGLEALQRQMQATRSEGRERAPNASEQVGEAARELEESGTTSRLARSAAEIERGRGLQAATRDGLITESLEKLQSDLEQAASVAATESGGKRNQQQTAEPGDLLAELGELRRALESAREQAREQGARTQEGLATANRGGDPGSQASAAREGEAGQQGGERGQQGQSGQGQSGDTGGSPGQQGGTDGARDGGVGVANAWGGGPDDAFRGGTVRGMRPAVRASGERLQRLRGQLRPGAITAEEIAALKELSDRLRSTGGDPMSAEYQRMVALVNQLELAALKAERAAQGDESTRAPDVVDDSRRYRDNVADYYRRLGQSND